MGRRPSPVAIVLIAVALIAVAIVLRPPADIATPSPAPTVAPATLPPSAPAAAAPSPITSALPSATASPSPSPTPRTLYASKRMGFALTLPPPWRKAGCGHIDLGAERLPVAEQFTSAPVMEEHIGHAGNANDRVSVSLESNPDGLTPMRYAQRRFRDSPVTPVTFAGRTAVEVRTVAFGPGDAIAYIFADGDRMYSVSALPMTSAPPDIETMLAILRSFRLLSPAERAALPDRAPVRGAAPTAQALAEVLKTAFEAKDAAALERVLGPCVSQGVVPGGGGSEPRERFIAELRQQLAAGLLVTVDASAVATDTRGPTYSYVWSRWNAFPPGGGGPAGSPTPQTYNVQLIFEEAPGGGWYWSGTLLVHSF